MKVCAVAGTSVGALNGALICMDSVENAQKIWAEMKFSRVMDVDDEWMQHLFSKDGKLKEVLSELWKKLSDGGVDVTPLRNLIHEVVDEEKIRHSGKEFWLLDIFCDGYERDGSFAGRYFRRYSGRLFTRQRLSAWI